METLSDRLEKLVASIDLRLKLVWAAQFVGYFIFVFIAFIAKIDIKEFAEKDNKIVISIVLAAIAFGCLVASYVFKRLTLSPRSIAERLNGLYPPLSSVELAILENPPNELKKETDELSQEEWTLLAFAIASFNRFIIMEGLLNSCAIAGLALSIFIGSPRTVIPFITCSVIVHLFNFPNLKRLLENGLGEKYGSPA
ncbi:MAG: hypothetical protein KAG97_01160 [Victivallales bacterium]|nr:hypothetical protein [Victivallales bacterium]